MKHNNMPENMVNSEQAVWDNNISGLGRELMSRFSQLSEQEADIFANMVNRETYPVLQKLFPELGLLFEQALLFNNGDEQKDAYIKPSNKQPQQQPVMYNGVSKGLVG